MENNMNSYTLSKQWFDWYSNTDKPVTSSHTAMFFYVVHVWNRSGQKENFGLPSDYAITELKMSNKTYYKLIKDLIDWGIIILIAESKNRSSSRVIRLCNFYTPDYTATYTTDYTADYTADFHSTEGILNTITNNTNIDNNISKGKRNSAKHVWAASPFIEYEKFEEEWIRLGDIETSQRKYKATEFDIRAYYLLLQAYGEKNPQKMYVNWVKERRNWVVSNFNKGEKLLLISDYTKQPKTTIHDQSKIPPHKDLRLLNYVQEQSKQELIAMYGEQETELIIAAKTQQGTFCCNEQGEWEMQR
jgi:hypothetical protein